MLEHPDLRKHCMPLIQFLLVDHLPESCSVDDRRMAQLIAYYDIKAEDDLEEADVGCLAG